MAPDDGSERAGRTAGSTNPFDFDDLGEHRSSEGSGSPRRQPAAATDGFDPFGLSTSGPAFGPARRGQRISWTAMILVVAGAVLVAIGIAAALGSIDLRARAPFGSMLWWGTLALVGFLIIVVGLVTSIVGVVQAEPRTLATLALIGAIVLGWVAAYIGFKIGSHQLALEAARVVGAHGADAVPAIASYLKERGIDAGPYLPILRRALG